jgi:cysteine desulfurase/selenocysteine lyase
MKNHKIITTMHDQLRAQFPSLQGQPHGKRLAFLDSAASALKPQVVLNSLSQTLAGPYANIHRGLYYNSATTTAAYEAARAQIGALFGLAPEASAQQLIFTRNTTEALNLVAHSFAKPRLKPGGAIVLSELEHHANIVPWQMVAAATGAEIRVIPLAADRTSLDLSNLEALLRGATVLALTHRSNVLGVRPPLEKIIPLAKQHGVAVVLDGSQAAVHGPVNLPDLAALGVDFWCLTGHKLYGPTGIGVLWGRPELLAEMPPYQGGGDMIETVRLPTGTTFAAPPARFEAGTPAIAEAIALGAAAQWLHGLGWAAIQAHEHALAQQLSEILTALPFLENYSPSGTGIAAFNVRGAHPADVATLLDQQGVAVRSGHHCAMPLMAALGLPQGCLRASVGLYTSHEDLLQLQESLIKAQRLLVG